MLEIIQKNTKSMRTNESAPEFIKNEGNGVKPIEHDGNAIVCVIRHEKHQNSWNKLEMYQASIDFGKKQQHII